MSRRINSIPNSIPNSIHKNPFFHIMNEFNRKHIITFKEKNGLKEHTYSNAFILNNVLRVGNDTIVKKENVMILKKQGQDIEVVWVPTPIPSHLGGKYKRKSKQDVKRPSTRRLYKRPSTRRLYKRPSTRRLYKRPSTRRFFDVL